MAAATECGGAVAARVRDFAYNVPMSSLNNACDVKGVADALRTALDMPLAERRERWQTLIEGVRRNDVAKWRDSFLERLYAVR